MSETSLESSWALPGILLLIVLVIWSGVWKGLALYRAGENRSPAWFIVLFLVNTLGILEILYLFIWGKKKSTAT